MALHKAMTIAGSDTSGGAGMEADLKTFTAMGVYGMTALTVIVAQNPKDWAHEMYPIGMDVIEKQIKTIVEGIGIDAMKTGMLGSAELVQLVADTIDKYNLKNVVIDPVMVCKGIDAIMVPDAAAAIKEVLVSRADVITPNTLEAAYLAGMDKVETLDEIKEAAARIQQMGAGYVVIKSGSRNDGDEAVDVLYDGKNYTVNAEKKLEGCFNHGAGCTFSAAITAGLAKGLSVKDALAEAKEFITVALKNSFRLNQFSGATDHCKWHK